MAEGLGSGSRGPSGSAQLPGRRGQPDGDWALLPGNKALKEKASSCSRGEKISSLKGLFSSGTACCRAVVELPSLERFKGFKDVVLGDMISGGLGNAGGTVGFNDIEVFSNLDESVVLRCSP